MAKSKTEQPGFEQQMKRLEEIVRLLERGDAPLEDALALFEEGAGLMKSCTGQLDAAELKVTQLMDNGAELPFDSAEEDI